MSLCATVRFIYLRLYGIDTRQLTAVPLILAIILIPVAVIDKLGLVVA